jgi:hypothetical protein
MSPTKKQERTQVLWKGKQFRSTSDIRYSYYCYSKMIGTSSDMVIILDTSIRIY